MILTICEKPSQARDIAKHLKATQKHEGYLEGNGYQVTWGLGHLLELAPPEYYRPDIKPWRIEKLPVIPDTWTMLVSSKTKKQFTIIKELLNHTNHVLIGSDPDRSGEAIVREILEFCHYQGKIERLWLSSLDDASIQKALKNLKPGVVTEALYEAEKSRAASDYLLGLNLTMAASSLYGVNSVLSLGRVQTPTLKLVVERDTQIENFISQNYFILRTLFSTKEKRTFWAHWSVPHAYRDAEGHCLDKHIVESIAAKIEEEPGQVIRFSQALKKQKAPLCFSLSALQKKASSHFGYGAKQVLDIVQSLYERHKAVTYPRTDSAYLPRDQYDEASQVIEALLQIDKNLRPFIDLCDVNYRSLVWNDNKVSAHHAMIPTLNQEVDLTRFTPEELNIYFLIRLYYLAQFMGDYVYQSTTVEMACAGERFIATGRVPMTLGWKQAFKEKSTVTNEEKENPVTLPSLDEGQLLDNQETAIESKQTQPPARFTEGTLIEAMKTVSNLVEDTHLRHILKESSGIGTEATRATILEILFKRGYLQHQGKQVLSTDKGRALLEIAPASLKDPVLTAQWEQQLDAIARGKLTFEQFVASQTKALHTMLAELKAGKDHHQRSALQLQSETQNGKVYLCPACQSPLRRLKNKKGKYFYGCSGFPRCALTTWEKDGKPSV